MASTNAATPLPVMFPLTLDDTNKLRGFKAHLRALKRSRNKAEKNADKMVELSKNVKKWGIIVILCIIGLWLVLIPDFRFAFAVLLVVGSVVACLVAVWGVSYAFFRRNDSREKAIERDIEEVRIDIRQLQPRSTIPARSSYGAVDDDPNRQWWHYDPQNNRRDGPSPGYPGFPVLDYPPRPAPFYNPDPMAPPGSPKW